LNCEVGCGDHWEAEYGENEGRIIEIWARWVESNA
jgi:hypothetical protein